MRQTKSFLLTLLIFFIVVNNCAGPQDLASDGSLIPTNVNTLRLITDFDSEEAAYKDIGQFLVGKGFTIKNSSPEFYSLTTDFKTQENLKLLQVVADISITALTKTINNTVVIDLTGHFKNAVFTEPERIKQFGDNGSVYRVSWNRFHNYAKDYSSNIEYLIK